MTTHDRIALDVQLQAAVTATGETLYKVAKRAGIPYAVLHRFMAGKRGISLETADQLARALGLRFSTSGKLVKASALPNTKHDLAARMLDQAFGGSLDQLVASALAHRAPSEEELARLRALLDDAQPVKKLRRRKT